METTRFCIVCAVGALLGAFVPTGLYVLGLWLQWWG